jgi:hypothetical protein
MMKTTDLLVQLLAEGRDNHNTLVTKVDEGFENATKAMTAHTMADAAAFAAFDKRLAPIESTRKMLKWTLGIVLAAAVPTLVDACMHLSTARGITTVVGH